MFKKKNFVYLISYIFSYKGKNDLIEDITTGTGTAFINWPQKIKTKNDILNIENSIRNNLINDSTSEITDENLINIGVCSFCLLRGE